MLLLSNHKKLTEFLFKFLVRTYIKQTPKEQKDVICIFSSGGKI